MAKVSPLLIVPPLVFAGLAALFYGGLMRDNAGEIPSTFIGQTAPALPDEAVSGTTLLTAADLSAGEVTIVNFWASWCPPCRAEHPTLQALSDAGYRVAGVNFRDQADDAARYLADEGDPFFATGFDPRGRRAIDWGVTAPPETFIVGPDGTVLHRFIGPLIGSDYEQRFVPMLESATE
ncbi:cytochrome c biogenesis protein CcmG, thiol:disulfide interchange protein DsbE [Loktanella sp. DSM 29012]|uniref:DsbE family thiol:disulfide interchange protein n=1 Tax=Loktanella gaetbuli TaxID=2881335 RepID=A0ABS8BQN4_9RHOB|nr:MULTISPECIES: DsbE family thiol:disulfide interchange protein [Loktanella]MCB5197909.1 DsbE family thiol:disulfide interchange protein [Loktanella gaetbuli]SEQ19292.1 cytochrome c biogenesis protein CcmG, thiol:disulfide interchange protein DsbE [Loktanella sp. DSM 29012]